MANEIEMTFRAMMIAIDEEELLVFRDATFSMLAQLLKQPAKNVKMSKYLKHPRGPKKRKQETPCINCPADR